MALTRISCASAAAAISLLLIAGSTASGHERLVSGDYHLTIGWADEPAFAGFRNAVSVAVADQADTPVTDAATALMVEVSFGDKRVTLPLEAVRQRPGEFRAWLLPTRVGTYAFRIVGTIRGQHVDATSTCSDKTFHCVADAAAIQFPAKDPSVGDLSELVSRTLPRAERAGEAASGARLAALFAAITAAIALVSSLVAMSRIRRDGK